MALKAELSGRPSLSPQPVEGTVATAIPELDRLLAGGFPPAALPRSKERPGGGALRRGSFPR